METNVVSPVGLGGGGPLGELVTGPFDFTFGPSSREASITMESPAAPVRLGIVFGSLIAGVLSAPVPGLPFSGFWVRVPAELPAAAFGEDVGGGELTDGTAKVAVTVTSLFAPARVNPLNSST